MTVRKSYTYDEDLLLDDGVALTSSEAGKVDSAAKIIDLGTGVVEGDIVVDVAALDVDTGNEIVKIGSQISRFVTNRRWNSTCRRYRYDNWPLHYSFQQYDCGWRDQKISEDLLDAGRYDCCIYGDCISC
jgi:hypothetical protein